MDYTEDELLEFIERHDEHEEYYRGKLAELRQEPLMTSSDPTPDDDGDDETFCSRCLAGVDSSEHHEKCVMTGFAVDGESAPTPGDHDELLAEAAEQFETGENHQSDIVGRKLIAALRTEQSARQEAEAQVVAIRKWNTLTNGRPRYRELDRLVNPEAWIDPDAAPAESKEPDHE